MNAILVADIVVAAGTLLLAFAAFGQVRQGRRSVIAAQRAAEAAERQAVATNTAVHNALRPLLSLAIVDESEDAGIFNVRVHNKGVGPARICLVTGRNDFEHQGLWACPLKDTIVAADEQATLTLPRSRDFSIGDRAWITSVSVWYEDVFGNAFRTRAVLAYGQRHEPNVEMRALELLPVDHLPVLNPNPQQPDGIQALEGGWAIRVRTGMLDLYKIGAVQRLRGREFSGNDATAGQSLQLRDVSFFLNDFPSLELCVQGHQPFLLTYHRNDQEDTGGVQLDATPHPMPWPCPTVRSNIKQVSDVTLFGLSDRVALQEDLTTLYVEIVNQLVSNNLWHLALTYA